MEGCLVQIVIRICMAFIAFLIACFLLMPFAFLGTFVQVIAILAAIIGFIIGPSFFGSDDNLNN